MEEKTFLCDNCGQRHPIHLKTVFRNQQLCPGCLEQTTLVCSRCGERIWAEDNSGTDSTPLCDPCYTHHYTVCDHCGRLLQNSEAYYKSDDDDNTLCYDCYHSNSRGRAIRDYYYKPAPIFYGKGPRFFGVELEVDGAGEDNVNARKVLDIANREHITLYCKHDGSLDDGFELVRYSRNMVLVIALISMRTWLPHGSMTRMAPIPRKKPPHIISMW